MNRICNLATLKVPVVVHIGDVLNVLQPLQPSQQEDQLLKMLYLPVQQLLLEQTRRAERFQQPLRVQQRQP
jgi:hypothetical protein